MTRSAFRRTMRSKYLIWLNIMQILLPILKAEDSLKSALNAMNRRQRDLSEYKRLDYDNYGFSKSDGNDNIAFLKPIRDNDASNGDLEKAFLDYLEKRGLLGLQDNLEERPSLFRERVEKDRDRHRKNMEEILLSKLYADETNDDDEPRNYYKYFENLINSNKRSYKSLGWNSVGMNKRSRYFQPDGPSESLYLLNYAPRDEIFKRLEEEDNDSDSELDWNAYPKERRSYSYRYTNPLSYKRFPVSKRSGNSALYKTETVHHHKRSSSSKEVLKTDPKVEKDLTNIFNPKDDKNSEKQNISTVNALKSSKSLDKVNLKENMLHTEKPIEVKKKSVNWSDYFGLDRRKKQGNNNEWFLKQYQTVAAQAQKRSEYPLNIFHEQNTETPENVGKKNSSKENSIKEMDEKLKNIEESIVDDALKFTGAHEDTIDSKEIQEVKDKIISRLAAAYSLEKMRRALREYEESLSKERGKNALPDSSNISEDKRIAVPRKQATDEHRENVEENNDIKCTNRDDNCNEQNYKAPSELLIETIWPKGDCPKIEQACNEVLAMLGIYGHMFESACNMYQICLLCGDNSWYYPNRQCNTLFLLKANGICDGNNECQLAARQSLKYLLQINQSLRGEDHGACEMECPDK